MVKNDFFNQLQEAYAKGADKEEIAAILGRGRAKKGMFEGDLVEGELEIGQVSGIINEIKSAAEIVEEIISEYKQLLKEQNNSKYNFND